jgi:hypothetical protein
MQADTILGEHIYGRTRLEDIQIAASGWMEANGVAVGCGLSIAPVAISGRSIACTHAACRTRLFVTRDGRAGQALANWTDISDVALLKRLRHSEEWLRFLCVALLRESFGYQFDDGINSRVRVVDGMILREPGKTGSQWRILYSIRLSSLECDFFEVTATIGEGSGESLCRLPVTQRELILADAGYCSVAGIEYVWQKGADALVRVNPQSFVAYSVCGKRICLLSRLRSLSKVGRLGEWRVVPHGHGSEFAGRLCAVRKSDRAIQHAHRRLQRKASKKQMITRAGRSSSRNA